jgi:OmpA-OmpF porin, OOP family
MLVNRKHSAMLAGAIAIAIAASLFWSSSASAQDTEVEPGFYLGAGITQSRWDADNFDVGDLDDEDNSWKAIAGYRFHPNFAVEANYIDFGEASAPATPPAARFDAEAKGFALYAVGTVPISMVDLYAKAGAARIDGEGRFGDLGFQDDATEFAYGAGIRLRLQKFGIHAEYEKFDTDVVGDLDLITLGATYSFGGSAY